MSFHHEILVEMSVVGRNVVEEKTSFHFKKNKKVY
jgi:hypothetical protein